MVDVDCHCFDLKTELPAQARKDLSETVLLNMAALASLCAKLATGIFTALRVLSTLKMSVCYVATPYQVRHMWL